MELRARLSMIRSRTGNGIGRAMLHPLLPASHLVKPAEPVLIRSLRPVRVTICSTSWETHPCCRRQPLPQRRLQTPVRRDLRVVVRPVSQPTLEPVEQVIPARLVTLAGRHSLPPAPPQRGTRKRNQCLRVLHQNPPPLSTHSVTSGARLQGSRSRLKLLPWPHPLSSNKSRL